MRPASSRNAPPTRSARRRPERAARSSVRVDPSGASKGESMRTTSWVLLTIVGALTFLVSLLSANLAYRGDYQIGPAGTGVEEVAAGRTPVLEGLRGIRGTSAAYAAGFAVLFLAIATGPYRRGDVWAWWALCAGILTMALIVLARMAFL